MMETKLAALMRERYSVGGCWPATEGKPCAFNGVDLIVIPSQSYNFQPLSLLHLQSLAVPFLLASNALPYIYSNR